MCSMVSVNDVCCSAQSWINNMSRNKIMNLQQSFCFFVVNCDGRQGRYGSCHVLHANLISTHKKSSYDCRILFFQKRIFVNVN